MKSVEKELFLFMEKNEETLKLQLFCQHRRGKATVCKEACMLTEQFCRKSSMLTQTPK